MTWPNEIAKWDFCRWMKVASLRDKNPPDDAQIYVINYESLPRLQNLDDIDVIVFDEITKAKNPQSIRIKALKKLLIHRPEIRRWGLTGTPRPNSLLDLFGQVKLLDDGQRLGTAASSFKERFFHPTDYMRYNWVPNAGAEDTVYRMISDITLIQRSSDYTDQPDTVLEDIEVTLPEDAKAAYKKLEKDLLLILGKKEVVAKSAAALVTKLRQICGGFVYDEMRATVVIHDAKIKALKQVLSGTKENVLIFTNFIHEREAVVAALGKGAVDAAKFRGDIEKEWNSGRIRWLVADPASMGHGLNMQGGGRTTVWYSLNYSRELYDQANARVARKGQKNQPLLYRLLAKGTIDEAVAETLREKGLGQSEMLAMLHNLRKIALAP